MRSLWFQKWIWKSNLANYNTRFHKIMWFSFDNISLGLIFRTLFVLSRSKITSNIRKFSENFETFFIEWVISGKWHILMPKIVESSVLITKFNSNTVIFIENQPVLDSKYRILKGPQFWATIFVWTISVIFINKINKT